MAPRAPPPESDREEERAERARLDQLDRKIRELRPRRQTLIQELLHLSDEQRVLFEQRAPQQAKLEELNSAHRGSSRDLARLRKELDGARHARDERLATVRELRALMPKSARSPAEQLRREIKKLELEQQTRAVPLEEENALIDRMREIRKELSVADAEAAEVAKRSETLHAAETAFETARADVERLRKALDEGRVARDRAMDTLKGELQSVGQQMAQLRAKGQERGRVRQELDEVDRTLRGLEREFDTLRRQHRDRRGEARRVVVEHNRAARRVVNDPSALDRAVDDRLEQLLKEGKVRLS